MSIVDTNRYYVNDVEVSRERYIEAANSQGFFAKISGALPAGSFSTAGCRGRVIYNAADIPEQESSEPISAAALSAKHMKATSEHKAQTAVVLAALQDFPVLVGRVTEFQAQHVVTRLNEMTSGEQPAVPFEIQVGGVYLDGRKRVVTIIGAAGVGISSHTYRGDNDDWYNKKGESLRGHYRYHLSPFDPMERIKELEVCLKHTRQLVSNCTASGFTINDDVDLLYRNNGVISEVVPMTPEERVASSAEIDKRT